jgi:quercetin dioxygenase-like cupin family protein
MARPQAIKVLPSADKAGAATVAGEGARAAILLDEGSVRVRRIVLDEGGSIPPCRMEDDVVFVVLQGEVVVTVDGRDTRVSYPDAVFVPGGAATRSMFAGDPALVLAVLCHRQS